MRKATRDYNLQLLNPSLAKEWHLIRNGNLKPQDVTPASEKKVWWFCGKGHEWKAMIGNRHRIGAGCPYCSGNAINIDNCLQARNPALAREWHPTKNGTLTPKDVMPSTRKKVWWICKKGHEWESACNNRNTGTGCPYCSSQKANKDNCLETINPKLVREWHPTRNLPLTPRDVTANSGKRVIWICKKGHEWEAVIANRNHGRDCPYCSNQKIGIDNNLARIDPELAKEWHPTKNGSLTPMGVAPGSDKKYWWICKYGHEWQARIDNRRHGKGCPYCAGQKVCYDNCLATVNPVVSKEWHPIKNGSLTPRDIIAGSSKKAWWICKKGHEWEAVIANRNKGIGCPNCYFQTSQIELRIYSEIKYFFDNARLRKKIHGVECDIYIPDLKLAIEYDSAYWHKDKYSSDKRKTDLLNDKGIFLLRIREQGLSMVSDTDISYSFKDFQFDLMKQIMSVILKKSDLNIELKNQIEAYIKNKNIVNENEFRRLLDLLPHVMSDDTLANNNPQLAQEWHPTKNEKLTPKGIMPKSGIKVWWLCKKGHEWQAAVSQRSRGRGCPYCRGFFASKENCLQTVNPLIAHEWHPTKNGALTPRDVTAHSGKRIWWLCSKGHEWRVSVSNRSQGRGCPYCSGRIATKDNCLQIINLYLVKEWHPRKNGTLTPKDVKPFSSKKVWWICKNGHEWEAVIYNRSKGMGCPYCSGFFASKENCLQTINPVLSKEWHPTKNIYLKPQDITPGSSKKAWWICKSGHEWEARVAHRNSGSGCPYCSGRKK